MNLSMRNPMNRCSCIIDRDADARYDVTDLPLSTLVHQLIHETMGQKRKNVVFKSFSDRLLGV